MRVISISELKLSTVKYMVVTSPITIHSAIVLPDEITYVVGSGCLFLFCDGLLLNSDNYLEIGVKGEKSNIVEILFDLPKNTQLTAVITVAQGVFDGLTDVNLPDGVYRQLLEAPVHYRHWSVA